MVGLNYYAQCLNNFKQMLDVFLTRSSKINIIQLASHFTKLKDIRGELSLDQSIQLLKIIGIFITCAVDSLDGRSKKAALEIRDLLANVTNLVEIPLLKNLFIEHLTIHIFEIVFDPDIQVWCIKEILRMYTACIQGSDKEVRIKVVKDTYGFYMGRLMDLLFCNGDYELQALIVENIFRLCNMEILKNLSNELIFRTTEQQISFSNINPKQFDADLRIFLNLVNDVEKKVYSILCRKVMMGDVEVKEPPEMEMFGGIWVDFNIPENNISFYINSSVLMQLSEEEDDDCWDLITVYTYDISTMEIHKHNEDEIVMHFHLKVPCTSLIDAHKHLYKCRTLILYTKVSEKVEELTSIILPSLIGRIHHGPSRSNGGKYQPLDIKNWKRSVTSHSGEGCASAMTVNDSDLKNFSYSCCSNRSINTIKENVLKKLRSKSSEEPDTVLPTIETNIQRSECRSSTYREVVIQDESVTSSKRNHEIVSELKSVKDDIVKLSQTVLNKGSLPSPSKFKASAPHEHLNKASKICRDSKLSLDVFNVSSEKENLVRTPAMTIPKSNQSRAFQELPTNKLQSLKGSVMKRNPTNAENSGSTRESFDIKTTIGAHLKGNASKLCRTKTEDQTLLTDTKHNISIFRRSRDSLKFRRKTRYFRNFSNLEVQSISEEDEDFETANMLISSLESFGANSTHSSNTKGTCQKQLHDQIDDMTFFDECFKDSDEPNSKNLVCSQISKEFPDSKSLKSLQIADSDVIHLEKMKGQPREASKKPIPDIEHCSIDNTCSKYFRNGTDSEYGSPKIIVRSLENEDVDYNVKSSKPVVIDEINTINNKNEKPTENVNSHKTGSSGNLKAVHTSENVEHQNCKVGKYIRLQEFEIAEPKIKLKESSTKSPKASKNSTRDGRNETSIIGVKACCKESESYAILTASRPAKRYKNQTSKVGKSTRLEEYEIPELKTKSNASSISLYVEHEISKTADINEMRERNNNSFIENKNPVHLESLDISDKGKLKLKPYSSSTEPLKVRSEFRTDGRNGKPISKKRCCIEIESPQLSDMFEVLEESPLIGDKMKECKVSKYTGTLEEEKGAPNAIAIPEPLFCEFDDQFDKEMKFRAYNKALYITTNKLSAVERDNLCFDEPQINIEKIFRKESEKKFPRENIDLQQIPLLDIQHSAKCQDAQIDSLNKKSEEKGLLEHENIYIQPSAKVDIENVNEEDVQAGSDIENSGRIRILQNIQIKQPVVEEELADNIILQISHAANRSFGLSQTNRDVAIDGTLTKGQKDNMSDDCNPGYAFSHAELKKNLILDNLSNPSNESSQTSGTSEIFLLSNPTVTNKFRKVFVVSKLPQDDQERSGEKSYRNLHQSSKDDNVSLSTLCYHGVLECVKCLPPRDSSYKKKLATVSIPVTRKGSELDLSDEVAKIPQSQSFIAQNKSILSTKFDDINNLPGIVENESVGFNLSADQYSIKETTTVENEIVQAPMSHATSNQHACHEKQMKKVEMDNIIPVVIIEHNKEIETRQTNREVAIHGTVLSVTKGQKDKMSDDCNPGNAFPDVELKKNLILDNLRNSSNESSQTSRTSEIFLSSTPTVAHKFRKDFVVSKIRQDDQERTGEKSNRNLHQSKKDDNVSLSTLCYHGVLKCVKCLQPTDSSYKKRLVTESIPVTRKGSGLDLFDEVVKIPQSQSFIAQNKSIILSTKFDDINNPPGIVEKNNVDLDLSAEQKSMKKIITVANETVQSHVINNQDACHVKQMKKVEMENRIPVVIIERNKEIERRLMNLRCTKSKCRQSASKTISLDKIEEKQDKEFVEHGVVNEIEHDSINDAIIEQHNNNNNDQNNATLTSTFDLKDDNAAIGFCTRDLDDIFHDVEHSLTKMFASQEITESNQELVPPQCHTVQNEDVGLVKPNTVVNVRIGDQDHDISERVERSRDGIFGHDEQNFDESPNPRSRKNMKGSGQQKQPSYETQSYSKRKDTHFFINTDQPHELNKTDEAVDGRTKYHDHEIIRVDFKTDGFKPASDVDTGLMKDANELTTLEPREKITKLSQRRQPSDKISRDLNKVAFFENKNVNEINETKIKSKSTAIKNPRKNNEILYKTLPMPSTDMIFDNTTTLSFSTTGGAGVFKRKRRLYNPDDQNLLHVENQQVLLNDANCARQKPVAKEKEIETKQPKKPEQKIEVATDTLATKAKRSGDGDGNVSNFKKQKKYFSDKSRQNTKYDENHEKSHEYDTFDRVLDDLRSRIEDSNATKLDTKVRSRRKSNTLKKFDFSKVKPNYFKIRKQLFENSFATSPRGTSEHTDQNDKSGINRKRVSDKKNKKRIDVDIEEIPEIASGKIANVPMVNIDHIDLPQVEKEGEASNTVFRFKEFLKTTSRLLTSLADVVETNYSLEKYKKLVANFEHDVNERRASD